MAVRKLVLVVVDAMKPEMLEQAVLAGRVPAMRRVMEEGVYVNDAVAAFPSVTPVCAATITTGVGPDQHLIPGMNWYHRDQRRYVEYGSSFQASRRFGVVRSLTDTVYRMNAEHLSPEVPTVFESLDDLGVRTAGTTYLIYRGRHVHEVAHESALARLVTSTLFKREVMGPKELFYADLYASRRTGCHGALGMPGVRDQHTGCVGAYLVEHELFDFMLFSLPDNDGFSHRNGPQAQLTSLAAADRQLERLMHAAGGPRAFLDQYAVIITSDHSQALVEEQIGLQAALADFRVATPHRAESASPELAICPSQRAAMVYVLDHDHHARLRSRVIATVAELPGVDLTMWRAGADTPEAVIRSAGGTELHFAPGAGLADPRGCRWDVEGEVGVLAARVEDGCLISPAYPDALTRVWSALTCATAGDVLLSAAPGFEFVDWGGSGHVGGGSHGSLHRSDSLAALIWCGTGASARTARAQWSLRDVAPMVREHFTDSAA